MAFIRTTEVRTESSDELRALGDEFFSPDNVGRVMATQGDR